MDEWYLQNLTCPRDGVHLREESSTVICRNGHRYPVVDGLPVMLLDDVQQTQWVAGRSLEDAWTRADAEGFYLDTVGISDQERLGVMALHASGSASVDPVIAFLVSATNGVMYKHLIGKLTRYPIPDFPLAGNGGLLLDVGCNWGRWSISAAKRRWNVVGIDPSLGAVLAARRVARSMRLPIHYVVGDARYLPFPSEKFEAVFSYGVLQHLSPENVALAISEMGRTMTRSGISLVQMPNRLGLRSIYQQARRGFRTPKEFEVRYWSLRNLRALFSAAIGQTRISVDCFGGLGIQKSDWDLLSLDRKLIIAISEAGRKLSVFLPFLLHVADSVYLQSQKSDPIAL